MSLYRLEEVSQVYGEREVLSIKHLELSAGRIYGLLGHNGSGKTTLLKILAFLDSPHSGRLYFHGDAVTSRNMAGNRGRAVWTPQFPAMFSGSVLYNIEYPLKIRGLARPLRRKKALELLDLVGLSSLAKAAAPTLSGGEAQRIALARALACGAEVLLLDEPSANVDAASRAGLGRLLENLTSDPRLTVIMATHDEALEERLCQTLLHLKDGILVSQEDRESLTGRLVRRDGELVLEIVRIQGGPGSRDWLNSEAAVTGLSEDPDGFSLV
ncbi:MAG: ATP-binding cassette domain-containing protein, partial [Deltaproteobacteria bacterium]|nr:ATP-binding cassette domain-containing protein [Deltaproteobacteria bacterium]